MIRRCPVTSFMNGESGHPGALSVLRALYAFVNYYVICSWEGSAATGKYCSLRVALG
jgi:hypothetical protein